MGRPTATDEKSEALRAIVRAIIKTDHEGTQRTTAEALGMAPSSLNDFLNLRSNAGEQLQNGLVRYLQRPIEEIVAAQGDLASLRTSRPRVYSVEVRFRELPMWPELLAGARTIDPSIPEWCWEKLAHSVVWIRDPITPAMVHSLAKFFRDLTPPPANR